MGYVVLDAGSGEVLESSNDGESKAPNKARPLVPGPELQLELVVPSKEKPRDRSKKVSL
jgi:hypothetical protein